MCVPPARGRGRGRVIVFRAKVAPPPSSHCAAAHSPPPAPANTVPLHQKSSSPQCSYTSEGGSEREREGGGTEGRQGKFGRYITSLPLDSSFLLSLLSFLPSFLISCIECERFQRCGGHRYEAEVPNASTAGNGYPSCGGRAELNGSVKLTTRKAFKQSSSLGLSFA